MTRFVYKIARKSEWEAAKRRGVYAGSPDDRRDGFIHLSAASQVRATCRRHFSGQDDLLLIAVDAVALGAALNGRRRAAAWHFPISTGLSR